MIKRIAFIALLAGSIGYADDILTNSPAWNGTDSVSYWGVMATPTYGQTVTVPTDGNDVLSSFTFTMNSEGSPSISFQAFVQGWDGSESTGSPLYTSAVATTTADSNFDAYTFNPDVALTPGDVYVLYFSTVGVSNPESPAAYTWASTATDTYSGGSFVYTNTDQGSESSGSIADLNGSPWKSGFVTAPDLAFSADFTSGVPEPSSIGLVLTGLGAIVWGIRRRSLTATN